VGALADGMREVQASLATIEQFVRHIEPEYVPNVTAVRRAQVIERGLVALLELAETATALEAVVAPIRKPCREALVRVRAELIKGEEKAREVVAELRARLLEQREGGETLLAQIKVMV